MDFDNRKVYGDTSITDGLVNSYQHKFDLRGDLEKKEVEELKDGNNGNAECEAIDATKVRKEHLPRVTEMHSNSLSFRWGGGGGKSIN